ncbi:nicotinamide mononucleotide transporter family protein [Streptomyces sp. H10-C2]|uniref:nicotinamide mononucleotide transporter family protein n=1 Tax=unclassified Streptomyces TaxID=2593676 RepID=UPI0024B9EFFA|nr:MULTISPECIES: nicotinamide mononucleotide transporter family protein [unclassified Streptomyces]MDJ0345605.1 nicotinamide mononucleotide transporter family protein [Streptomyces sp. PH10-H1]MDJ0371384.1 nicotinamide mononucleotide transporter family protein [Streptomyces sp. H10-C2]
MSALGWLNSEAFTVFDQHIMWSDMAGNLLGLGALALGWRRSLLTWPVQLLSGLVLVAAYASAHLSGGIGKQVVVVTVAVWGWTQWRRGRGTSGDLAIRFAGWAERAWLVAGTAAGTVALAMLFTAYPKLSWDPWPDAYIFVGTLTAMVAQARGWVEFWFAWLAVDVVGVPLAFNNGLAFSGLVYVIYFVLVVFGMRAWWLQTRTDRAPSGTVPDGATA